MVKWRFEPSSFWHQSLGFPILTCTFQRVTYKVMVVPLKATELQELQLGNNKSSYYLLSP